MIDIAVLPAFLFHVNSSSTLLGMAEGGEASIKVLTTSVSVLLIVILLFSCTFGEIALRIGLPTVLGDLVAGLLLGVSALHIIVLEPGGEINGTFIHLIEIITGANQNLIEQVLNSSVRDIIEKYSDSGVLILLFLVGLESDIKELIKVGTQAATVAIIGVVLPFLGGFLGLTLLFQVNPLPALFVGAALTATSIGITAKVMQEIGVLKSQEGQIILGAAILDDILGIVILAIVVGIVEQGKIEVGHIVYLVICATAFVLGAVILSQFFGKWYVSVLEKLKNPNSIFIGATIFGGLMGIIARALGLEPILGAFAAGLIIGETDKTEDLQKKIQPFIAIFTTIFFVSIGATTDLSLVNPAIPENQDGLIIASFLIIVAIIGKTLAGFAVFSQNQINRLAIGTGMIPRGEVGLVFAGLGASTGALPPSLDVAIVLMVIATTFIAPLLLKIVCQSLTSSSVAESEA